MAGVKRYIRPLWCGNSMAKCSELRDKSAAGIRFNLHYLIVNGTIYTDDFFLQFYPADTCNSTHVYCNDDFFQHSCYPELYEQFKRKY